MIDMLLVHGAVVSMDAERRVLENGAVAIDLGRILAVGPTAELESLYAARETVECRGRAILPG